MEWLLHLGWDYTPAQALWLNAGFAPAGPINWFTYVRPELTFRLRF